MSGRHATRYNHRDENEPELLRVAEQCGATWQEAGPLDGWVFHRGMWKPVEIKNGKAGRLRPSQAEFIALCRTLGAPCLLWRTVDDVLASLGGPRLTTEQHENGDGV